LILRLLVPPMNSTEVRHARVVADQGIEHALGGCKVRRPKALEMPVEVAGRVE
jgi:hypothetical protein